LIFDLSIFWSDFFKCIWGNLAHVMVDLFSSFFIMSSRLFWDGYTWHLPFNRLNSIFNILISFSSSSFSLAIKLSQVSTRTCSSHDGFAQQELAQDKLMKCGTRVQVWGGEDFTIVNITSWVASSNAYESMSFSWEHSRSSYLFCNFICLLMSL
jgi:hypothetical protein